jgi:hypothetical protein
MHLEGSGASNEARKPCAPHLAGPSDVAMVGYPLLSFFLGSPQACANGPPAVFTGTHLFCRERLSRLYRSPGFSSPRSGNHPETGEGDGGIILALRG